MNDMPDITARVRSWLREPVSLRGTGVDRVAEMVHDTSQQRGWLPPLSGGWTRRLFVTPGLVTAGVITAVFCVLLFITLPSDRQTGPAGAPASEAASPGATPAVTEPGWPGVDFEPLDRDCEVECRWDEPGAWAVTAADHGDFASAQAIAFGPIGPPWFLSDDTVWQLGVPGSTIFPPAIPTYGQGDHASDLAVTADGILWVASKSGLHAFDGEMWTERWSGTTLTDLTVAPDGAVLAVGGGAAGGGGWDSPDDIVVVRVDDDGVSSQLVDVISKDRWPTSIAAATGGDIWVSAIASGYLAPAVGESLLARFDGETWETAWPLGDDHDPAAWDLETSPDGSLWATLWTLSEMAGLNRYLASFDGQDWHTFTRGDEPPLDIGISLDVAPDGNPWFTTFDSATGEPSGIGRFAGLVWFRYLDDVSVGLLEVGPDGTAWVTTSPGFDEVGRLFAIRP